MLRADEEVLPVGWGTVKDTDLSRYNLEMKRGVKAGGTLRTEAQMEEEAKRSDWETADQRD